MAGDGLCVVGLVEIEVVRGIGIVFLLRVVIGHGDRRGGGEVADRWSGVDLGLAIAAVRLRKEAVHVIVVYGEAKGRDVF